MDCRKCDGLGFYYERGQSVKLRLCSCVEGLCRCGGRKPYQYFDENLQPQWCDCRSYRQNLRRTEQIFAGSGVPAKFGWKFLDDFREKSPDGKPIEGAEHLRGLVGSLVDHCVSGESARGFLFWGTPGNGKTMLSCIALNELMLRCGKPGKFVDLSLQYFQKLRSTYSKASEDYGRTSEIIEELITVPFLVIDDFGVQRGTEWEDEVLYNLIDARYQEERVTIITTNKNIEYIRTLADGRIYSRFLEMCHIVQVRAPDYRVNFRKVL